MVNDGDIFTPFWDDPVLLRRGEANWPPSAVDPNKGVIYVCAGDRQAAYTTNADIDSAEPGDRYTGGNISLTGSTNWSNLTTIGTAGDLVLAAAAGDLVEMAVSMKVLNQAVNIGFDAVTVVSATVTNSFANNGAASAAYTNTQGISGWWAVASEYHGICGSAFYKLVAGDISSNTVTLRIRYAMAAATNRTLQANAGEPVQFWARNHGPVEI